MPLEDKIILVAAIVSITIITIYTYRSLKGNNRIKRFFSALGHSIVSFFDSGI